MEVKKAHTEEGEDKSIESREQAPKPLKEENVVLVLGATGKTGQNLINQLADKGMNIRVLVRRVGEAREQLDDST